MKIVEESVVEAGSEEVGKPVVKGFITGVLGVAVEQAHEHGIAIGFFVILAGSVTLIVIHVKRQQRKKENHSRKTPSGENVVHHDFSA